MAALEAAKKKYGVWIDVGPTAGQLIEDASVQLRLICIPQVSQFAP